MGYNVKAIFLSASVPVPGRGDYFRTSDPFLVQTAVREFMTLCLGRRLVIWGGHPAITPMVWSVCEDLGVTFANAVVLYQSEYFRGMFPDENAHFGNVVYTNAVTGDLNGSLLEMRTQMLSRTDLDAAVFIGGMEGVQAEYDLFKANHPEAKVLPVPSTGGAARVLAQSLSRQEDEALDDIDFAGLFYRELAINPTEPRNQFEQGRSNGATSIL